MRANEGLQRGVTCWVCLEINQVDTLPEETFRVEKMTEDGEETKPKGFKLLGFLDVQNIPCSRGAILHGAGGSLAAGLLHFLATSRVRRSFDVGLAGFMLTTLGSWFYCRANNVRLRMQQRMIQEGIKNQVLYEGTAADLAHRSQAEKPAGPS